MKTNVPIKTTLKEAPVGDFSNFLIPGSSWANNDKLMKQLCGSFEACGQINKSSGGS